MNSSRSIALVAAALSLGGCFSLNDYEGAPAGPYGCVEGFEDIDGRCFRARDEAPGDMAAADMGGADDGAEPDGGAPDPCLNGALDVGEEGVDCGGVCAAPCAPEPSCEDGEQNQGEEGVDCGGPCDACPPAPTCEDGVKNQREEEVDCGGPSCPPCASCSDGEQNQGEQGVDCGGPCAPCASCSDGEQNQGEEGVDCGGPCDACPSCEDGEQNQGEEGVDCGGPCPSCSPCTDGELSPGERGVDCGGACVACMVDVPGATFTMGSAACGNTDCSVEHMVTLSSFRIDETEVTVAQYRACVEAGACVEPWTESDCSYGELGREDFPVNCVTHEQAATYCQWAGKRLPTEAEWEYAALGAGGRAYPWGDSPATCDYAVVLVDGAGTFCGMTTPAPVASKPLGASPFGALDMLGNAGEWTRDWYASDYYSSSPASDPAGPAEGTERVYRGLSYVDSLAAYTSRSRFKRPPETQWWPLGFRCVASP